MRRRGEHYGIQETITSYHIQTILFQKKKKSAEQLPSVQETRAI